MLPDIDRIAGILLTKCITDLRGTLGKIPYLESPNKIVGLYLLLKHSFVDKSNDSISFREHANQGEDASTAELRRSVMGLVLAPLSNTVMAKSAADYLRNEPRDNIAEPSHANRVSPRDLYNQLIHWILDGGIDSYDVHSEHRLPLLSDITKACEYLAIDVADLLG